MKLKRMCMVIAMLLMIAGMVVVAFAGPPGPGPGQPGGPIEALQTFLKLNLSADQQKAILALMAAYESQKQALSSSLMAAHEKVRTVMEAESFDEQAVRSALQIEAGLKEDLAVIRGRMMAELKALLTAEQIAILQANRPPVPER